MTTVAPAPMQVWRTDLDGLYAVVAVAGGWVHCKRSRGYKPEHRFGDTMQVHPACFRDWELVTPGPPDLSYGYELRGFPEQTPTCLTCYRLRACPGCGREELVDLIPRSLDPFWLRCCGCGTERSMPFHRCTWDRS